MKTAKIPNSLQNKTGAVITVTAAWDLCFPRIFMVLINLCRSWSSKLYFHAKSLISGSNKSFPQCSRAQKQSCPLIRMVKYKTKWSRAHGPCIPKVYSPVEPGRQWNCHCWAHGSSRASHLRISCCSWRPSPWYAIKPACPHHNLLWSSWPENLRCPSATLAARLHLSVEWVL